MKTDLEKRLAEAAELTEKVMDSFLANSDTDIRALIESMRYSVFSGGKRIRAYLVLSFSRIFGGKDECALKFAAAVEMIHTYSLIHDDLPCMDNDDMRRGLPTNHKVFGEDMAVLSGDALQSGAFELISSVQDIPAATVCKAICKLARASGSHGMVGGQTMDISSSSASVALTLQQLEKLHSKKTGALIVAAAELGCLCAGVDCAKTAAAKTYAAKIGLAFQVKDDLLDRFGDAQKMGKNVGRDEREGKITFLSFMSREQAEAYMTRLTSEAIEAISAYDTDGGFARLADYLLKREK